jgi:arylamine N-acetyltransferase
MAIMTSQHPTYSRIQLARYISHIYQLPLEEAGPHLTRVEEAIRRDPLASLTELQRRHLSTIPFGNVVLHYSQHRTISLDNDLLFHKLVERGLGGYCVENTGLFAIVLRSLGFQIYTGGAKVSRDLGGPPVTGRFHGL